jgi:hypothetical protein
MEIAVTEDPPAVLTKESENDSKLMYVIWYEIGWSKQLVFQLTFAIYCMVGVIDFVKRSNENPLFASLLS